MTFVTLKCNQIFEILNEQPWTIRSKDKHKHVPVHKVTGGYLSVCIDYKHYLLHRLVAQQFKNNTEDKPCVMFKDGNPDKITLSNLLYATRSDILKVERERGNRPEQKTNKEFKCLQSTEGLSRSQIRRWKKLHNVSPYANVAKAETDGNDFADFI